ncbi:hypothetical protein RRG08_048097 [Elysia crispata]|uniref:Uncharacterized protein n=1 Tax=Elysia crispata TaxID=231223 RepID=A0AAE1B4Y6_9GAST|nr:hypothetical protein RRG08_048097 [Elysia crispata]
MVIDRFQLPKICKEKSQKFLSFLSGKSLSSMSQGFFGFRRESERINIKAALKAHQLLTSTDFDWRHSLWRILTFLSLILVLSSLSPSRLVSPLGAEDSHLDRLRGRNRKPVKMLLNDRIVSPG